MKTDVDVLIIGAGPAGLSAARQLSDMNIEYTLLSKEISPGENKACGGFVPISALNEFNIDIFKGAWEIYGIRMKFPGMDVAQVDFDTPIGINTTRRTLGIVLMSMITNVKETIRMGSQVRQINITKDLCRIKYSYKDEELEITSKIIIDASGTNPVSLKNNDYRGRLTNDQAGYAIQYHYKKPGIEGSFGRINDFYYGSTYSPGGYAWIFPRKDETVLGTGGIVTRVRSDSNSVDDYLTKLISEGPVAALLTNAQMYKKEAATLPLAGIVKPSYSDRIMLAGDAAGHCSPISGEGIHYALVAGKRAAQISSVAIQKNDYSARVLKKYEKAWMKDFGSDLKWGLWLQKRFAKSGSKSLGSTFLSSEKSQRIVAEMLAGNRSVRSTILSAAPGYIRSKF
ncbi:MAG: NAD(P)/FAD-dependent oxidoreductase [Candidatus Thorarchaeota archaeon]